MNAKIIAIVAVAVVAVAAVSTVVIINNNDKGDDDTKLSDVRFSLQILGNANEDTTIDDKDLKIVEKIISGDLQYKDYPYADANNDKKVDDADKELVQKLINREKGTKVFIVNTDSSTDSQSEIITEATYPLTKIVPYGVNIVEPIVAIDGGRAVAAYFAKGYPNQETSMQGVDLKGGSRSISEKAWKNFTETDATVGFDAFVITYDARAQLTETYRSDLVDAGIPIICYPAASPDGEANAALTLGFMFGGISETLGAKYADIYNKVLDEIDKKVGSKADSDKTVYLAMTMYTSICQNDSTYQLSGTVANGTPYYKTDSAFAESFKGTSSTASSTVEALSNINAKKILNFRSMDQETSAADKTQNIIDTFEYENSKGVQLLALLKASKLYNSTADTMDGVYLINNVLPAPARVAYSAAILYDELTFDWADGIMQMFIDEKFTSYDGKTLSDNIVTYFGYEDYKKAKS